MLENKRHFVLKIIQYLHRAKTVAVSAISLYSQWMRWKFENHWKVSEWCLLNVSRSYLMVSIYWHWHVWSIMLQSSIFSCFSYMLYRKWLKITFFLLPTCFTPQRKLKFAGKQSFYHQDDILKFWRWLNSFKIKVARFPGLCIWPLRRG